jgi:hypothetical protein
VIRYACEAKARFGDFSTCVRGESREQTAETENREQRANSRQKTEIRRQQSRESRIGEQSLTNHALWLSTGKKAH